MQAKIMPSKTAKKRKVVKEQRAALARKGVVLNTKNTKRLARALKTTDWAEKRGERKATDLRRKADRTKIALPFYEKPDDEFKRLKSSEKASKYYTEEAAVALDERPQTPIKPGRYTFMGRVLFSRGDHAPENKPGLREILVLIGSIIVNEGDQRSEYERLGREIVQQLSSVERFSYKPSIIAVRQYRLMPFDRRRFVDVPVRAAPFALRRFPDDAKVNAGHANGCAINLAFTELKAVRKRTTRASVVEALAAAHFAVYDELNDPEKDGVTPAAFHHWAELNNVSLHLYDAFGKLVLKNSLPAASGQTRVSIVAQVTNDHVYGITDAAAKRLATNTKSSHKLASTSVSPGLTVGTLVNDGGADAELSADVHSRQELKHIRAGMTLVEISRLSNSLVYVDTSDLTALYAAYLEETGEMPSDAVSHRGVLTAFVDERGETRRLIQAAPGHAARARLARSFAAATQNNLAFHFKNESVAELARRYMQTQVTVPKSTYSRSFLRVLRDYPKTTSVGRLTEVDIPKSAVSQFDTTKAFTASLLERMRPYPLYSVFDEVEPFELDERLELEEQLDNVSEYYISEPVVLLGALRLERGFYSGEMVKNLGDLAYVLVTQKITASRVIPGDTFAAPVTRMRELAGSNAKGAVNFWVGTLGRSVRRTEETAFTTSYEQSVALVNGAKDGLTTVSNIIPAADDGSPTGFFVTKTSLEAMTEGHMGIYRAIIDDSLLNVLRMVRAVCGDDPVRGAVVGVSVDAIQVMKSAIRPDFTPTPESEKKPGDIVVERVKPPRGRLFGDAEDRPEWTVDEEPLSVGCLTIGGPGRGKSVRLKKLVAEDGGKKTLVTAWTKKAVENLQRDVMVNDELLVAGIPDATTLDAVFHKDRPERWLATLLSYDRVCLDEFTIAPEIWYRLFRAGKEAKPSLEFYLYGDPDQSRARDERDFHGPWVDYAKTPLVVFLTGNNRVDLPYREDAARFDKETKQDLDQLLRVEDPLAALLGISDGKGGTVEAKGCHKLFTPDECDFTLVEGWAKRDEINTAWFAARSVGKDLVRISSAKSAKVSEVFVGMPLCAHKNHDRKLVNSTRYYVTAIDHTEKTMALSGGVNGDISCGFSAVAEACRLGYAETVMRTISSTIRGRFNIVEVEKMSLQSFNVAFSRATCEANIGIDKEALKARGPFIRETPPKSAYMLKLRAPKARVGYIYELRNSDDIRRYIGKTIQLLRERLKGHVKKPTSPKTRAWVTEETTIHELWRGTFTDDADLSRLELQYIHQACLDGVELLNTDGVLRAASRVAEPSIARNAAKEPSVVEAEAAALKATRIREHTGSRTRFRIKWNGEEKDFSFSKREGSRERAYLKASAFWEKLVREGLV